MTPGFWLVVAIFALGLAYVAVCAWDLCAAWLRDRRRPDPLDEAVALGNGGRE